MDQFGRLYNMAGTIQADFLQPQSGAGLTILTPSGNTIATLNSSGMFSNTGIQMLSNNGSLGNNAILFDVNQNVGVGVLPTYKLDVLSQGNSATHRSNIVIQGKTNGSGLNATLRLSDNVSNSSDISMTAGNLQITHNGLVSATLSPYGIGLGGNTATSGTGIAFPATQSASSDPNTLDDYEEGTWTPTWGGTVSDPTATYGSQTGRYVKIGRMVWVYCAINVLTFSGGSGNLLIRGLPFAVDPNAQDGGFAIGQMAYWNTFPSSIGTIANSTNLQLYKSGNNTPSVMSDVNTAANSDYLRFQGCYLTAN